MEQDATRAATAIAYPNLGLDKLIVHTAGYTELSRNDLVTAKTIDARVPPGAEREKAADFWQAVILRAAQLAFNRGDRIETIRQVTERFTHPEDAANNSNSWTIALLRPEKPSW